MKKYARNAHSGQDLLHFRGPRKRAKMFLLSQDEFDTFSFLLLIKKSKNFLWKKKFQNQIQSRITFSRSLLTFIQFLTACLELAVLKVCFT